MKMILLACVLALCSCKSPGACDLATETCTNYFGPWVGMPTGGSPPTKPKEERPDTFHAEPGCRGPGYIAGYGEEFPYASVRSGGVCSDEDGVAYGFRVS
jgi:hypothetical protein